MVRVNTKSLISIIRVSVMAILLMVLSFSISPVIASAASGSEFKVISVQSPDVREYNYPVGTSFSLMTLPEKLVVSMTDGDNVWNSLESVTWNGYYDSTTPGVYWMDSEMTGLSDLDCSSLALNKPVIKIVLSDNTKISRVTSPAATSYTMPTGTGQEELLGLFPKQLTAVFTTTTANVTSSHSDPENVTWICRGYDPQKAGDYRFTAQFTDSGLYASSMPSITVTLR